MDIRPLTPELSVAPQIAITDLPAISAAGFRTLICNRPDGESPDQPRWVEIEAAARAAGLATHFLPAATGQVTPALGAQFAALLETADKPVLAYCRSGTRSATLWALGARASTPVPTLLETAARAGYDLSGPLYR